MARKALIIIIIILILIAFFVGAYYITNEKLKDDSQSNLVTGNIIYDGIEPDIIEPIKSKSAPN